jgi:hypothetical protein
MRKFDATTLIGIIGIAGGLMILLAFPVEKAEPAVPTIKVPGPYPYETPVQLPAARTVSESPVLPTPAPFPYREPKASHLATRDHDSRTANARRPVTARAVREAAFKYNGVPGFCGFLAVIPANVSVFDPKLGTTRTLVQNGHVVRKNVAWLRKDKKAAHKQSRTLLSAEELGARHSGI